MIESVQQIHLAAGISDSEERDGLMTIDCKKDGTELTLSLEGRLDASTAFQLDEMINNNISGATKITFDCVSLEYLSSAGLRVLLNTQKVMNKQGTMELIHVSESVRDVFALTGLLDILTVVS